MLKFLKYACAALLTAAALTGAFFAGKASRAQMDMRTCKRVEVHIVDSSALEFVRQEDIKEAIGKRFGTVRGVRPDSVKLQQIEYMLMDMGTIKEAQAWIEKNGTVHVKVRQREPAAKFCTKGFCCYADENGFLFPMQRGFEAGCMEVVGNLPFKWAPDHKGPASEASDREWICGVLSLVSAIRDSQQWKGSIPKIEVTPDGCLVATCSRGNERIVFGDSRQACNKLERLSKYYEVIAPSKPENWYGTVNLAYEGQIICK